MRHLSHPCSHPGELRKTSRVTPTRAPVPVLFSKPDQSIGRVLAFSALLLAACQPVPDDSATAELARARAIITRQEREIGELTNRVAELQRSEGGTEAEARSAPVTPRLGANAASEETPVQRPAVSMCYKDYCPCDPPQGGGDSVICDQLEEGIPVDVELMIAGRGAREARWQLGEGGY